MFRHSACNKIYDAIAAHHIFVQDLELLKFKTTKQIFKHIEMQISHLPKKITEKAPQGYPRYWRHVYQKDPIFLYILRVVCFITV